MLALAFGIPEGVGSGWMAMLGPNMQAHHFSQDDAGWVGFAMTVAGCVAGILAGQILDIPSLARQKKAMVILFYGLCAASATVFALGCDDLIRAPRMLMFGSAGLAGAVINAVYGNFDIILDDLLGMLELCATDSHPIRAVGCALRRGHAHWMRVYFVAMLIGCVLVLAIRFYDRFTSSGWAPSSTSSRSPLTRSSTSCSTTGPLCRRWPGGRHPAPPGSFPYRVRQL